MPSHNAESTASTPSQTLANAKPDKQALRTGEKRARADDDTEASAKKLKIEAEVPGKSSSSSEVESDGSEDEEECSEEEEERETCFNCGEEVYDPNEACCKARRMAFEAWELYGGGSSEDESDEEDSSEDDSDEESNSEDDSVKKGKICHYCREQEGDEFTYCCKMRGMEQAE